MLFNSIEFLFFLPIVFILYWLISKTKLTYQNLFILVSSYIFYGWWDWRFLFLIFVSTLIDYGIGLQIYKKPNNHSFRKKMLLISIFFNIGTLCFFKYCNFFIESFIDLGNIIGLHFENSFALTIILPVGISFYTFQTMSYSIDIYREKITPTSNFIAFASYVSFFPQLVAGPIERASNLLPQILSKRQFNYVQIVDGLKLILWGLFKKIVIADSLAPIVDDIFTNFNTLPSSTLALGTLFFSFQIYSDFSGYSDIAIGTAKLFGIELMSNFKFPYFSKNIGEFWRKWHISLSTWFRDYIYIPLGGSRVGTYKSILNIFIIFIVSGFWHGANWTYVVWGGIHAFIFIPSFILGNNRKYIDNNPEKITKNNYLFIFFKVISTFLLVSLSWIFFRANSITSAIQYLKKMFSDFTYQSYSHPNGYRMIDYFIILIIFIIYEFLIKDNERKPIPFKNKTIRFIIYIGLILSILLFYNTNSDRSFIYFQF
tara:strand:- start:1357 stop:2811 length:1455 start_codon:yes stop_codon:yes gene_type:complete